MNNDSIFNPNGYEAVKDNLTPLVEVEDIDDFEVDDSFNYDGFQVVRGEFFAHVFEPSLTFNNGRMSLNMACIKSFEGSPAFKVTKFPRYSAYKKFNLFVIGSYCDRRE